MGRFGDSVARLQAELGFPPLGFPSPSTSDSNEILIQETPTGVQISIGGATTAGDRLDVSLEQAAASFLESAAAWAGSAASRVAQALDEQVALRGGQPVAVGLSLSSSRLAAQPWELLPLRNGPLGRNPFVADLVRHDAGRGPRWYHVRFLQRVLTAYFTDPDRPDTGAPVIGPVDGAAGQRFAAALRWFAGERGLPGLEAPQARGGLENAVLRELADIFRERRDGRSSSLRIRILAPAVGNSMAARTAIEHRVRQVEGAYRSAVKRLESVAPHQAVVSVTYDHGPEVFAHAAAYKTRGETRPCDVVHLCGPLRAAAGMPLLGVPHNGRAITGAELDSAVQALTGVVPPLLVLDFLAPPSDSETRRQLLQRNAFAQRLLALGNVDTIVATGFENGQEHIQPDVIAREFAEAGTAVSVCRAIRSAVPPGYGGGQDASPADTMLPYGGTALFSGLQSQAIFEPGLFSEG